MWWQNWRSNSGLSSHKPQIGREEGGVKKEDREREEIRREKRKQVIAWGLQRKEAREHPAARPGTHWLTFRSPFSSQSGTGLNPVTSKIPSRTDLQGFYDFEKAHAVMAWLKPLQWPCLFEKS